MLSDSVVTVGGTTALGGLGLSQLLAVLLGRAMDRLLEDRLRFVDVELGLEGIQVVGVAAAVGAATSVGETEVLVDDLLTSIAPVTSAAAVLLDLLGVDTLVSMLGEIARQVLLGRSSAVGQAGVVTVVVLVRASHLDGIGDEEVIVRV